MDRSQRFLTNVDRANSTLFKRYLEEQHRSVIQSNSYKKITYPINSTIEIINSNRNQQNTYVSKFNNENNRTTVVKRKYSYGRKLSSDAMTKQRGSHTSRFMKRFQRQHKYGETMKNLQNNDEMNRLESNERANRKQNRVEKDDQCSCLTLNGENHDQHQYTCLKYSKQVPSLSLNGFLHSSLQHQPPSIDDNVGITSIPSQTKLTRHPLAILPSFSNLNDEKSLPSISIETVPSSARETHDHELSIVDHSTIALSNDFYPLINDFLQEISVELTDKPSVDILLEIEESLVQRIYNCIVEEDYENEQDTNSYSTTTNDSSALSTKPIINMISNDLTHLPPSPIKTIIQNEDTDREKYFQPIREHPVTSLNENSAQHRHSTPFNYLSRHIQHDNRSPFTQSLFEPVNLLRTVTVENSDDFNFLSSTFTFDSEQQSRNQKSKNPFNSSLSFANHLLMPRMTSVDTNASAFKPIETSTNLRSTTSFELIRPHIKDNSSDMNWFGQS